MSDAARDSARFLHPASGALILGLDWVLFSGSVFSLGLSTPLLGLLGFGLGSLGVALLQSRYGGDSRLKSGLKGVLGGIVIGVPMPIAGTAVGGLVLALSGLNQWRGRDRDALSAPDHSFPKEENSS